MVDPGRPVKRLPQPLTLLVSLAGYGCSSSLFTPLSCPAAQVLQKPFISTATGAD
jgi:hypothetical protein